MHLDGWTGLLIVPPTAGIYGGGEAARSRVRGLVSDASERDDGGPPRRRSSTARSMNYSPGCQLIIPVPTYLEEGGVGLAHAELPLPVASEGRWIILEPSPAADGFSADDAGGDAWPYLPARAVGSVKFRWNFFRVGHFDV